ncbi:glycosyltransferase family 4 protein [Vibrio rotiferianus]|uniref:glycosyltransferase family 4 protein n=1 Tax=Vibrio rotiferianus TaxID=190895 RepID=UPI00406A53B1
MKKITFVCARFYPDVGGVEKHVLELSRKFTLDGYKVTVITVTKDKSARRTENYEGINIIRILAGRDGIINRLYVNFEFLRLIKIIIKSDYIHFHDYFTIWGWNMLPVIMAKAIFKKKIYITFHGWEGDFPPKKKVIFKRKIINRFCDGSISIGHFIGKWYSTTSDIVSYGATSFTCLEYKDKSYPLEKNDVIKLLFIGRLEPDTGIREYLEQISNIKDNNVIVDICGDGSLRDEVLEFISKSGGQRVVNYHGFVKDIETYIDDCDFVLTSGYLGILESFARKKLVISVYDNELKHDYLRMIPNSQSMLYICDAEKSLNNALFLNQLEKQKMIEAAYEFSSNHSWDSMQKNYLELWER